MKNGIEKNFTKLTPKKGISLIVLIVTIIVIIILAAVVILTITKNNPINSSKEAVFKDNYHSFVSELEVYKGTMELKGENSKVLNASKVSNPSIQDVITCMNDKYASLFEIMNGKLVYVGKDKETYKLAMDMDILPEDELLDDEVLDELQPFITEWTVEDGDTIVLPLSGYAHNVYKFTVDYGDSTGEKLVVSANDENASHKYQKAGTYTVTINGQCPDFTFYSKSNSKDKITRIVQWGNVFKNNGNNHNGGLQVSFSGCSNLKGPIPEPSKNSFKNLYDMPALFRNCTSLETPIPEKLFYGISGFDCRFAFENSGVTGSIPENLFKNCTEITSFDWTFDGCKNLTGNIPENLFENNKKARTFTWTFNRCVNLTGDIPEGLFKNNTELTSVYGCFSECIGLDGYIYKNMFNNNTKLTNFSYTFRVCKNLKGEAPEVWLRENTNNYCCFSGCTSLSNFNEIPSNWKQ